MVSGATSDVLPERVSPAFMKIAGICAILTAVTTVAVHWLPDLWSNATTFESRVQLQHNTIYMARLWIVLIHCVLVAISMAPIPCLLHGMARLIALFGFACYVVFAFVEIFRTSLSIFAVNRAWRAGYETSTDDVRRQTFRDAIETFAGVNEALFFLFFAAFTIGLFSYGFALLLRPGITQGMGLLFLLWGVLNLPDLVGAIAGNEALDKGFEWVGRYFQPVARLSIGICLWKLSSQLRASSVFHQPSTIN
jgi:hypothetical protein